MSNSVAIPNSKDHRQGESHEHVPNSYQLSDFFGQPRWPVRADERLGVETFDDYQAYEGSNLTLKTRIDELIVKNGQFYLDILPVRKTDEIHVKWDIFSFDRTLMDLEPTEGVPRLVTARKEGRNDTLVRRGLAMMIEHGFYKTEQGRKHYALNLNQIAASARLTTYAGVIEALLSGRNHYREWMRNHGPPETGERTKEYQRQNWACVNKNEKGIFLMAAEAKYQLQREGVVPDTIVLPPRMGMYAKWAHERLSYRESGPKADATLYGEALSMTRILGCDIFETEAFDVDFSAAPVNQLQRQRQCGEYLDLGPADGRNREWQIYSAESDQFEDVTLNGDTLTIKGGSSEPLFYVDSDGRKFDGFPGGEAANYHHVLLRPHATWNMCSAIVLKKGEELGVTLHGNHSFLLQSDNVRKIHLGHYTYYSKSVVTDDRKLMLMEDVYCTGYVGGEGHTFYSSLNGGDRNSYHKQTESPIDHETPSLIYALIHKTQLTSTHMNIKDWLGVEEEDQDDSVFLQDYIPNNYDCFQGCVKVRSLDNQDPSKTAWRCSKQPRGHWLSVYNGVRNHRCGRTGAFIKEP